jgi:hypothetical protein
MHAGVVDRIADRAHILETGTESYRFRRTAEKQKKGARPRPEICGNDGSAESLENQRQVFHPPTGLAIATRFHIPAVSTMVPLYKRGGPKTSLTAGDFAKRTIVLLDFRGVLSIAQPPNDGNKSGSGFDWLSRTKMVRSELT